MASLTDISLFPFPTLASPDIEDVITASQFLREESDRRGRQPNPFRESDRPAFQREAVSGSRLDRVLAALDALAQERPAAALTFGMGGPIGAVGGLAALTEGRALPQSVGDALRDIARAASGGRSLTQAQARAIQRRAEREDREANRDLREGRGSGASPRRGDVSNAGR